MGQSQTGRRQALAGAGGHPSRLPRVAMPCLVMPCHAVSCLVMPCHAVSCLAICFDAVSTTGTTALLAPAACAGEPALFPALPGFAILRTAQTDMHALARRLAERQFEKAVVPLLP